MESDEGRKGEEMNGSLIANDMLFLSPLLCLSVCSLFCYDMHCRDGNRICEVYLYFFDDDVVAVSFYFGLF